MQYRKLGDSDLKVSVVGLGTWAIGGDFWGQVDDENSQRAIQAGIDQGINLIDTAPAYGDGHAETVVGRAIKGRRDEVIVATKVGVLRQGNQFIRCLKPESIRREIDDSLRRLGVDVIDLYQIHWPDKDTPLEDSLAELIRQQEKGKFRYLGVSNFDPELMDICRQVTSIVSLQPQYSLLKRDIEDEILPYCRKNGLGVLAYGPLGGGILTGKYREKPNFPSGDNRSKFYPFFQEPLWSKVQDLLTVLRDIADARQVATAQVAINWVISQPGVTAALVGAKTSSQATQNAAAGDWQLSEEELRRIEDAYRRAFA